MTLHMFTLDLTAHRTRSDLRGPDAFCWFLIKYKTFEECQESGASLRGDRSGDTPANSTNQDGLLGQTLLFLSGRRLLTSAAALTQLHQYGAAAVVPPEYFSDAVVCFAN